MHSQRARKGKSRGKGNGRKIFRENVEKNKKKKEGSGSVGVLLLEDGSLL
jgi:hypothetical protein